MGDIWEGTPPPNQTLEQCKICGRTFFTKVLAKHLPICQKTTKRKVFDSSRQRSIAVEIHPPRSLKSKRLEPVLKKMNWRRTHEEFINTIQSARALSQVIRVGGPLPPPPPPFSNPDYIQCPFCERRFNQAAAERHISFCKEQASRLQNQANRGRPRSRPQYKPPPLRKGNSGPTNAGTPGKRVPSAGSARRSFSPTSSDYDFSGLISPTAGGHAACEAKFCYDCGSRYPSEKARFCCECGLRRLSL